MYNDTQQRSVIRRVVYELKKWRNIARAWLRARFQDANDVTKSWSRSFEWTYWRTHTKEDIMSSIRAKYEYMNVDALLAQHFPDTNVPLRILDVGGGMYGGALAFISRTAEKTLFDYLADEFKHEHSGGTLPDDIRAVAGSFTTPPFQTDSFDVVLCWEALDHADTTADFKQAQRELVRVTRPGGLIFFEMPIRYAPQAGHPISMRDITRGEILDGFPGVHVLRRINHGPSFGSPHTFILILQKR